MFKHLHILFFVGSLCGISNESFSQLRIGIQAGGNISSVLYSPQVQIDQARVSHADIQKPVYTYNGGGLFQMKIGKTMVIRVGIEYFKKAWMIELNTRGRISAYALLRKYNVNYVQVPVNAILTSPLGRGRAYVGAGPYIAYALNGSVKSERETYDLEFKKFTEPTSTYIASDAYKPVQFINHYTINRIDYGGLGIVGYEFSSGLYLETGVNIGTRQISTSYERYDIQWKRTVRDPSSSVRYSIVQLAVGWMVNFRNYRKAGRRNM